MAALSKEKLLEMVDAGIDTALIVSLVEKDCIDFDMDADNLLDLSSKVPKEVLQAAIECRERTPLRPSSRQSREGADKPRSLECIIYTELTTHPGLRDFPLVVSAIDNGYATITGVKAAKWAQEKTDLAHVFFKYVEQHQEYVEKALATVRRIPGIKDAEFRVYTGLSTAEVKSKQDDGILVACSEKGKVNLRSSPTGANVSIDGKQKGKTPLEIELPVGKHEVEVSAENYVSEQRQITIKKDQVQQLEIELTRLGEISIRSTPEGSSVFINGKLKGITPLTIYGGEGGYVVEVAQFRFEPFREEVDLEFGQSIDIFAELKHIPRGEYCYLFSPSGKIGKDFKALEEELISERLMLVTSLYKIVTSIMERQLPVTHVVNGKNFGYEPKYGANYAASPEGLLGRELGGLAFGETASAVVTTPPGQVTVAGIAKRNNTIVLELLYPNGVRNSIYFDFDKPVTDIEFDDFYDALCLCFSKHQSHSQEQMLRAGAPDHGPK